MPGLGIYVFGDGGCVGAYFGDEALSDDLAMLAPWLEFAVENVAQTTEALVSRGVQVVPYAADPEHSYFRVPGGPVFRLA